MSKHVIHKILQKKVKKNMPLNEETQKKYVSKHAQQMPLSRSISTRVNEG